ncbi:MAG: YceI family protein [Saprospiraceae bacterium]|nr:YceI family protein [Saprospiraceae bacterium]MDW8483275.1 YceI family protein [Saprospiraceae bacterium]
MRGVYLIAIAICWLVSAASAQKFMTRDARVSFLSEAPLEKIEAINKSGSAVLDAQSGRMEWKVLIKNFIFEKKLMQEHFNENYMESHKYPNATFKGEIVNVQNVQWKKDGSYDVRAKGKMTIHGVERDIEVPGKIVVVGDKLNISSEFKVACADYNITIPAVVRDNIAKEVMVRVEATLVPLNR